ncbi:helix-turn-helix domain-containing protein [Pseudomonas viridiflava]|uniref:helix-turn-helix domain-containing protein n=1 Tax=Pseudomonas viridiflava TaxID=33069 RepID=UPI000F049DB4
MASKSDFGIALRQIRNQKRIPQESLGPSQSFISSIERGRRSPTLERFEQLAASLDINPVTLLAFSHLGEDESSERLLAKVKQELEDLGK